MFVWQAVPEHPTPPAETAALLSEFKATLHQRGMASMEEFGDMLDWPLPRKRGMSRHFHVFHPDMCSFDDTYRGTVHYHGGAIRGTVLAGGIVHDTYEATPDAAGDRHHDGSTYRLRAHRTTHAAGTTYQLPAFVPHWIRPTQLTLTYFEEEDNGTLGDLLEPRAADHDDHRWTQAEAEALVPTLLALVDRRLGALTPAA